MLIGWTADILADANVYAEHAHRNPPSTAPQMDDVKLAIQARLEQTMSTPWPREVPSFLLFFYLPNEAILISGFNYIFSMLL